jgi:hypothetical protein
MSEKNIVLIDKNIIFEFNKINEYVPKLLKSLPVKQYYIIEKLGMNEGTFNRKLKQKNFSSSELLKIAEITENIAKVV